VIQEVSHLTLQAPHMVNLQKKKDWK